MSIYELTPNDSHKSFYGKALIIEDGTKRMLRSYNTIVCEFDTATNTGQIHGYYSRTTARHIRAFLFQYRGQYTDASKHFIK